MARRGQNKKKRIPFEEELLELELTLAVVWRVLMETLRSLQDQYYYLKEGWQRGVQMQCHTERADNWVESGGEGTGDTQGAVGCTGRGNKNRVDRLPPYEYGDHLGV
mmetsp:Transcript_11228/g.20296  ORF Transcript_11228/g.20296 Transcript_11228/m.20296 type:complete len:107 (+) Transcript_11228:375-695(+)